MKGFASPSASQPPALQPSEGHSSEPQVSGSSKLQSFGCLESRHGAHWRVFATAPRNFHWHVRDPLKQCALDAQDPDQPRLNLWRLRDWPRSGRTSEPQCLGQPQNAALAAETVASHLHLHLLPDLQRHDGSLPKSNLPWTEICLCRGIQWCWSLRCHQIWKHQALPHGSTAPSQPTPSKK